MRRGNKSFLRKKHKKEALLILNYVMDPNHYALAHQVEIVEALSKSFPKVVVITGNSKWQSNNPNLIIMSTGWLEGRNLRNIRSFYRVFVQAKREFQFISVFSHMTVVQSGLIAPYLRLKKIKHVLWYAHAADSFLLRWASFWVNLIVTSTEGSCPIRSNKVRYLGQSIKVENFPEKQKPDNFQNQKFVHIGRMDKSKNIGMLIETVNGFRKEHSDITLNLIGVSSNSENENYIAGLKNKWEKSLQEGWLVFSEAIPRANVPMTLQDHDVFIHAFVGSLDKSLLEATLAMLPVATINKEYHQQIGSWSNQPWDLGLELDALFDLGEHDIRNQLELRRQLVIENHSFTNWINKLSSKLFSDNTH